MKTSPTRRWLDATKAMHGYLSDYRLAKALGVTTQRISNYRAERTGMDDELAVKIAELTKVPAILIMAELHAAKSVTPSVRKAWTDGAKLIRESAKISPENFPTPLGKDEENPS